MKKEKRYKTTKKDFIINEWGDKELLIPARMKILKMKKR